MNPTIILSLVASAVAFFSTTSIRGVAAEGGATNEQQQPQPTTTTTTNTMKNYKDQHQFERALSGSGDVMSFDDDFWSYDQGSMDTYWADYAIVPKKCMIL